MSEAWPPAGWTTDDCLTWLGADLGKAFGVGEARDAVGRWVAGGGAGRARRKKGAINLAARLEGQRVVRTKAKRTLHGKDYETEADAIHTPDDEQDEDAFQADLDGARQAEQTKGRVVLEHHSNGEDHPDDIRDSLMSSYDSDRRNKPSWLTGRAAAEDRKHVEKAVDSYLANGGGDQELEDGEALHLSVSRSDDSLFAQAKAEHEMMLKHQGMKAGDIKKELSGEADEARDKAKSEAIGKAADAKATDRYATLKAAYPKEFAEADGAKGSERGYLLFKLGDRYQRETGKKLPY